MTASRLIPLPVHGALELLTGVFAMVVPFLAGFEPAATVVSVVVGALLVGLALAATATDNPADDRATMSVSTHHAADNGIALVLMTAAGALALNGDATAGVTLAGLALVQFALTASTKYTLAH